MRPFVVNGQAWRVVRVSPGDPRLIDRTGIPRLATTDPQAMTICISEAVVPPLLDKVMVHEAAHAVTVSYGLLPILHAAIPEGSRVHVEEWAARLVEEHGIEAAELASESLGRPVCVRGYCHD